MYSVIKKSEFIKVRSYFPGHTSGEQFKNICCLQSCGKFVCTKEYSVDRRDFDSYLLYYVVKGKSYLKYNQKNYVLKEGEAFLIDCNHHQIYGSDENDPCTITYAHFAGGCSEYYYNKIVEEKGNVYSGYEGSIINNGINNIFDSIDRINKNKVEFLSNIINSILNNLLSYEENASSFTKSIQFAKKSIIENTHIKVEDMARSEGYSKYHFTKKFKQKYSMSPYEYIIKERIELSKKKLANSNALISSIAFECGFNDTSHFTNCFKKRESISPTKFRDQWKVK